MQFLLNSYYFPQAKTAQKCCLIQSISQGGRPRESKNREAVWDCDVMSERPLQKRSSPFQGACPDGYARTAPSQLPGGPGYRCGERAPDRGI